VLAIERVDHPRNISAKVRDFKVYLSLATLVAMVVDCAVLEAHAGLTGYLFNTVILILDYHAARHIVGAQAAEVRADGALEDSGPVLICFGGIVYFALFEIFFEARFDRMTVRDYAEFDLALAII